MPSHIVDNSPELSSFIGTLGIKLSEPQRRHVLSVADGLLVTDAPKTLAEIRRQFVDYTDVSNIADCFRISPWQAEEVRVAVAKVMMHMALQRLEDSSQPRCLFINLDDSLAIKDPYTRHLEGVDWHFDHAAHRRGRTQFQNALAYTACNITAGDLCFTFAIEPYLRAKTVRRINRTRPRDRHLHFIRKSRLARRILEACRPLIPADVTVYVQFDSWYASEDLINYVLRQGWHVTCRIQPNRLLNGERVDQRDLAQRHQRYDRVVISAADGSKTTFLVRRMVGRIKKVHRDVCVLVSRRHYRDRHPVYFLSTDLTLSPQRALQGYAKRWNCEVDHWYLKQRLGLGDFRLQSYEAIGKFCAVVHLAWAYVQWRLARTKSCQVRNAADVIRQHREEHERMWLKAALYDAISTGNVDEVLARYLPQAA